MAGNPGHRQAVYVDLMALTTIIMDPGHWLLKTTRATGLLDPEHEDLLLLAHTGSGSHVLLLSWPVTCCPAYGSTLASLGVPGRVPGNWTRALGASLSRSFIPPAVRNARVLTLAAVPDKREGSVSRHSVPAGCPADWPGGPEDPDAVITRIHAG